MNATPPIGTYSRNLADTSRAILSAKRAQKISRDEAEKAESVSVVSEPEANRKAAKAIGFDAAKLDQKEPDSTSAQAEMTQHIREIVKEIQGKVTALQFRVDEQSQQIVVQVVNKASGEVIRQIPPEEILRLSQRLEDLRGVLFDHQS